MLQRFGTCVIADDTPHMRMMLQRWLTESGIQCFSACGGNEALRVIESCRPDIVVTDLDMPQGDGLQLLKKLREHVRPDVREIPVVVISSMIDAEMEDVVKRRGGNAFLSKPVGKQLFLKLFFQAMRRSVSWATQHHPIARDSRSEPFRRLVARSRPPSDRGSDDSEETS